ncbi:hypothetical protein ACROYT_G003621 [Oculina patagonica]
MRTFLLAVVALTFCRGQTRGQNMEVTNLSSWNRCSSICLCAVDNQSRIYGQCSVNELDESVEFNLSRELYYLSLANNGISVIRPGIFRKLDKLEFLSLANNSIELINEKAFQGLNHLRILDLQNNDVKEWNGDTSKDLPLLEVLKMNGNKNWIPSQRLLNMPMLKEVLGVTWSKHCFTCDLIKVSENETLFGDDEMGDYEEDSGDYFSGEVEEDMTCHVTLKEFYYHPKDVKYGVSARFVKQGFSPQCFCDYNSDCYNYDVIIPFLRQLYSVPRKLFLSQYALGGLIIVLNLIVLVVIITSRLLRNNISFILVGSVAFSDLLIGVHGVAIAKYNLFSESDDVKPRVIMETDTSICTYMGMIFTVGQVTAVINSLLLTLERYLVIVYFQKCRGNMKKGTLIVVLSFVWIAAIIFASLPLLGVKRLKYHKWFQCTMPFHAGTGIVETSNVTLSISGIFVFLYLVSLALYGLIFCYARKSSVQFGIKREARLARKIAVLVSSNFILFTLPTVLLLVYVYSFSDALDMAKSFSSMRSLFIVGGWLPVTCFNLNSLVNPFLYPFKHSRFKKEVRSFSSRLRNSFSNTFHPVVATAHQLSLRTSALSQHLRHQFHSFAFRREGETSIRVEFELGLHQGRRASV